MTPAGTKQEHLFRSLHIRNPTLPDFPPSAMVIMLFGLHIFTSWADWTRWDSRAMTPTKKMTTTTTMGRPEELGEKRTTTLEIVPPESAKKNQDHFSVYSYYTATYRVYSSRHMYFL